MKKVLGAFLIISGILAVSGSAGDWDGACIDQANTISEMLMAMFIGILLSVTGTVIMFKTK